MNNVSITELFEFQFSIVQNDSDQSLCKSLLPVETNSPPK